MAPRASISTSRNATAFNRSNNYGGRWSAGYTHPGWNRGVGHYWNNHYYRWYDGGWLNVDGGFWPGYGYGYDYPYYGYNYYNQPYNNQPAYAAIAANVQSKLAQLGYYSGDVDGRIGPLSRQAIENYQTDQGLPVTGNIDQPLLHSLGLA